MHGFGGVILWMTKETDPMTVIQCWKIDGSMMAHQRRMYGTEPVIDWNHLPVSQTEHLPQVYDVIFPKGMTHWPCPFTIYIGSSHTCNGLWDHFNRHRWGDSIRILEDKPFPFPQCDRCGIQVPRGGLTVSTTSRIVLDRRGERDPEGEPATLFWVNLCLHLV